MPNVIKGNAVDFEKVSSLDGTFIINRYNKEKVVSKSQANAKGAGIAKITEFDEEDIIAEEAKKSRMQRPTTQEQGESKK
jgi:hypothetical protein